MSFSSLNIGASALTAAQRAVETAAHNVANSSVEGYTRQRLGIAASPPGPGVAGLRGGGMLGTGVSVISIDRLRNDLADVAVRQEAGSAAESGARAGILDRAQGVLGPYGGGVPAALNALFTSFDQLALTPASPAARQLALDAAASVADGVRDAATALGRIREDGLASLQDSVGEVNAAATEVADLNRHIADALVGGQAPNDLLDRRDLALDRLASLAGAVPTSRPDGMVDVTIGGVALVSGASTSTLTMTRTAPPAGQVGDDPGFSIAGRPVSTGGALSGGAAALVTDLREFDRQLDGVAVAVAGAVNAQQQQGYDADGAAGRPIFLGSTARDLVVDPALKPSGLAASATQKPGGSPYDGQNALALARLRKPGADGVALSDRLASLAATLGSRASSAGKAADAAEAALDGVRQQREASNGVSIDEEMVDLVKFQHSYDAAARVVSMADDMLDTIINRMGAGR